MKKLLARSDGASLLAILFTMGLLTMIALATAMMKVQGHQYEANEKRIEDEEKSIAAVSEEFLQNCDYYADAQSVSGFLSSDLNETGPIDRLRSRTADVLGSLKIKSVQFQAFQPSHTIDAAGHTQSAAFVYANAKFTFLRTFGGVSEISRDVPFVARVYRQGHKYYFMACGPHGTDWATGLVWEAPCALIGNDAATASGKSICTPAQLSAAMGRKMCANLDQMLQGPLNSGAQQFCNSICSGANATTPECQPGFNTLMPGGYSGLQAARIYYSQIQSTNPQRQNE